MTDSAHQPLQGLWWRRLTCLSRFQRQHRLGLLGIRLHLLLLTPLAPLLSFVPTAPVCTSFFLHVPAILTNLVFALEPRQRGQQQKARVGRDEPLQVGKQRR